ncbi:hypothetical protein [Actinokineospora sp.]|uniref:hypothetical protein n=1 Tax=Actinokineospora sp. TaxID=1872133 RepID=UPI0040379876
MTFTMEYTSKLRDITYALTIAAQDGGDLGLDLVGADDAGSIVAEGTLRLPAGGATETAKLMQQALTAISTFEGRRVRRRVGNSHAPWTSEQDTALRVEWLTLATHTPATSAIRELAAARERSPAAIRARLARVGCDPDVAGRLLTQETAELVGRDAAVIPD